VAVPKWMIAAEGSDTRPIRSIEKPVPLDKIRLVYPLTDPKTGTTRDVIVKQLINGNIFHDRHAGTTRWSRYIPGLGEGPGLLVPWPKREVKEHKDHPSDTLRLDVEVKSFVPTLLHPPIPGGVIDELRNKYSKFRTRHDPEYITVKMQEDVEKKEKKKLAEEMISPLREANRLERKLKRAKGKGKLTTEMLERIGQVIAKKRQLELGAAGMSEVDNSAPAAVVV
jgi:large subunit ribosomal protein L24